MNIGILTFHWATNYGAVLQSYALQCCLSSMGHDVEIIKYKPKNYDLSLLNIVHNKRYLHPVSYIKECRKEQVISQFRTSHLHTTPRCFTTSEIAKIAGKYDMIISGSDQVMNPYFLTYGECKRSSSAYFLGFPYKGRRMAYAVSFGCTEYPQEALAMAQRYIEAFGTIGVREKSGVDIVAQMGRNDAIVVPDPTALAEKEFYKGIAGRSTKQHTAPYGYLFFIRNVQDCTASLRKVLQGNIHINNNDGDYSVEGWLSNIAHSEYVVTDSFHATMMALKLNIPFAVVTHIKGNIEMNDRFYSLLGMLDMTDRMVYKDNLSTIPHIINRPIDWDTVNSQMARYKQRGIDFLRENLDTTHQ